jgi:hypothetical protein
MPKHPTPDVLKTWAMIDGEREMIDVWKACEWSGARFKVVR